MPDTNLSFAKIVATPTPTSWSQAYNAGSLFMVIALSASASEPDPEFNVVGKEFFNTFESEFFTLEDKSLESIKKALADSCQKIPPPLTISLALVFIKQNILYGYSINQGKIQLRREGKIGRILISDETTSSPFPIATASGFLQHNDTILLETAAFAQAISPDALHKALELNLPNDIAETLALPIHGTDAGDAACIVITFQGSSQTFAAEEPEAQPLDTPLPSIPATPTPTPTEQIPPDSPLPAPPTDAIEPSQGEESQPIQPELTESAVPIESDSRFARVMTPLQNLLSVIKSRLSIQTPPFNIKTIIMGIVAIILVITLFVGIYVSTRSKKDTSSQELFNRVYPSAQKDYDEGEGLITLNKNLARDDFLAAQKKLNSIKNSFPKDSKENKQVQELLAKVNEQLKGASGIKETETKEVSLDSNYLLSYANKHANTPVVLSDSFLYSVTDKAIVQIDTGNDKEKSVVTNDNDWSSAKGIGVYLGNLYLLDSKNGILKFVPSGSSFNKSSYFPSDTKPDLSKGVSLSIDGSVWILLTDGTIEKFTKGKADSFTITGLDKPFSTPSKLVTDADMANIYILDNGNNRIVVIKKDGTYQAQYVASSLKNATDVVINEKDKKADFLSSGKAYEIGL